MGDYDNERKVIGLNGFYTCPDACLIYYVLDLLSFDVGTYGIFFSTLRCPARTHALCCSWVSMGTPNSITMDLGFPSAL